MSQFRYIRNSDIDRSKWDKCISVSFNNRVYALSWYLDVVAENWGGLVYNDYQAVFPIVFKKFLFLNKCYQPFFCQQLGLFYQKDENDKNTLHLIDSCFVYLNSKIKSFEFCSTSEFMGAFTNLQASKSEEGLAHGLIPNEVRCNLVLDLKLNYHEIVKTYSKNTIRNLKRAGDSNLTIKEYLNTKDVFSFFKMNLNIRANLKDGDFLSLYNLMESCMEKGLGKIIGVLNADKKLIACGFFIRQFNRDILIYNTSDKNHKESHGMTFLIDSYIKENVQRDAVLDFEGSNLSGVFRFYQGFGAIENNYLLIKSKYSGFAKLFNFNRSTFWV